MAELPSALFGAAVQRKRMDSPILKGAQIYHNCIKPHEGLGGKTPAEAAGIQFKKYDADDSNDLITICKKSSVGG